MASRFSRTSRGIMLCVALGACSAKQAETPAPPAAPPVDAAAGGGAPAIPEAERIALDSANAAFRAKDYAGALAAYRRAVASNPTDVAPWFGIHMVATATKNTALADSALKEMRARGGAPGQATDSALQAAHKTPAVSPTAH
jgi:hypothetical protein